MPLELVPVPCLKDNYAYLIHDAVSGATGVIDAPEAGPIVAELARREWRLTDIFLTHHHEDHIAGVSALKAATGGSFGPRVWGAEADRHRLPHLDWCLWDGDKVSLGREEGVVFDVPGHTLGHIAFYFATSNLCFTGDSLMAGGCGRVFEGKPEQMWASLQKIAALPPETLICSGHEYTASNLSFAATIEPANPRLAMRQHEVARARGAGLPSVPVTLEEELATNPFLRANLPEVKAAVGMAGAPDAAVFAEIRGRKDRF